MAYEMRISDWCSDVCSSDLGNADGLLVAATSVDGFNNFPNETGTLMDISSASVGSDRGFVMSTARHHVLGTNAGQSIARYTINARSEEHTSELQSLMRISYAVFCLKKKNTHQTHKIP